MRATDASGNVDPTPATWTWTVNTAITALSFAATADATVEAGNADTNFGMLPSLEADLSPEKQAYVLFSVTGVTSPVISATLRLFVTNGSSDGPQVFLSDSSWAEGSITWNTRPGRIGAVIADVDRVKAGDWVEYDVTSVITADGQYSFELAPQSGNGADFKSREAAGSDRPELSIVLVGGTDTTPPETFIESGPVDPSGVSDATLAFSADEPGSAFECRLDGVGFDPCVSPVSYMGLTDGGHLFEVRATDIAGNTDPTPASWSW